MPTADVYSRLARHLDRLPGGFPPTESGVELRILRRLFTEAEAELALALTFIPEEARVVARRTGLTPDVASRRLETLARRGLCFSFEGSGRPPRFMAAQFVIGIWEYHVNDLDEGLVRDVNEYIPHLFDGELWRKAPQLRTIPVGRSIAVDNAVLPHEEAERLVRSQRRLLVAPCICRRESRLAGKGCGRPEEACLVFGAGADYYERNGLGRRIGADEAVAILRRADEAGLVLQPSNAKNPVNICCCCGCCCQVLKCLARQPRPAKVASSPFAAALDAAACVGCGLCVGRCQMAALTLDGGRGTGPSMAGGRSSPVPGGRSTGPSMAGGRSSPVPGGRGTGPSMAGGLARLDPDRCIGCGLCVSVCPTRALSLVRKPEPPRVPRTVAGAALQLGRIRGTLGPGSLVWAALRSKFDRLLAAR